MADRHNARAEIWSRQLTEAHDTLRRRLQQLQANLDSDQGNDEDLLTHCLAFCSALTTHHQGEDTGMFPELLRIRPDLRSTVDKLVQDHEMITGLLMTVRGLADEARSAEAERRTAIRGELDGLAAIMDSHFSFEERAISAALDQGVQDTGWSGRVLGLGE